MNFKNYSIIGTIVVILLCSDLTLQQSDLCNTPDEYDLKNLTIPNYWQIDLDENTCIVENSDSPCHFYFAFCHIIPFNSTDLGNCKNSSTCQFNGNPNSTVIEVGHFNDSPFAIKEANGFFASYEGGRIINRFTNQTCNVSIVFDFNCNSSAVWVSNNGQIGDPSEFLRNVTSISDKSCQYILSFDYAGACNRINPVTTTTTTQSTTTEFNPTPAKLCIPPKNYDISPITKPPYWSFNIDSGCALESNLTDSCGLSIAFCKPIQSLSCDGKSACLRFPNVGSSFTVGDYTIDPFVLDKKEGFDARYLPGDFIINRFTNKTCQLSIVMKFECDLNAVWELPEGDGPGIGPTPLAFFGITNTSCEISITVPYFGACLPSNGLSGGSILLIIFFVSLGAYIIIGSLYNKFVSNNNGAHIMPHYDFWASTILYALEGFIYAWKFITCQISRQNKMKYDSI